ncbi:MAG: tripartite tricarboxylate transporter TctB family protein [Paracoccaceae bacterium]|jgi:putative tricarboxylic transport membrane protein|nr:tripartite tricarboxylate transporter TctB family protein [Paracoccaceae bacterium]
MRFESATSDRITAAVFFALGAAMAWGGYTMDRLEIRQIHPASIPGLVPMILGAALMLCAALLFVGAREDEPEGEGSWEHFLVAAGWSIAYALGMVGQMPFTVATAIYLAGFVGWFLWRDVRPERPVVTAAGVVVFSVVTAIAIAALFRYGFLVRLP